MDLKGFDEEVYRKLNSGKLQPILRTLAILKETGVWFEIINLVVPTYTDKLDTIRRMSTWIAQELGPDQPLHFSRFHPQHKLTHLMPTPVQTLVKAREARPRKEREPKPPKGPKETGVVCKVCGEKDVRLVELGASARPFLVPKGEFGGRLRLTRAAWAMAVASGVLQILIYPLPALTFLCWVALAPLLVAIMRGRASAGGKAQPVSAGQGFLLAYIGGVIWSFGSTYWIYHVMHNYGGLNGLTSFGVLTGALPNAPVSGRWFEAQFEQLVQNAYPPFVP